MFTRSGQKRWLVVLAWVLGLLSLGLGPGLAQAQTEPTWRVVQTWILPQEVGLGQHFLYRVRVRLRPGYRLILPPRPNLGVARVLAPPTIQRSPADPNTVRVDLKLAIYQVRRFGRHVLPALWVSVAGPDGAAQEHPLPKIAVEVIARYENTRRFQLQEDPQVTLPPALRKDSQAPSHEWRPIGALQPLDKQESQGWDPLMLAAVAFSGFALLLFGLGLWLRQKRRKQAQHKPLPPYDVALQQLAQLKPPGTPTPQAFQGYYGRGVQILRAYLQDRLSCPVQHLTGRELPDALARHTREMFRLPDEWWEQLRYFLQECETFCYSPAPPGPFGDNLAAQIRTLLDPVEAQMVALEAQEEDLA